MPSFLHEASFDYLKCHLTLAIAQLPYDPELVETTISMNYPLKIGGSKIVNPDMTITISAVDDAPSVVLVPAIGECAFSQNRDKVFKRMEDEIEAHPDAVLAIIVLVREGIRYACPNADSIASKELRNGEDDPQSLTLDEFISQRTTPRSFDTPIRVGEHDWCHIQSVEYFVWVKGDHQDRIDVRNYDPQFMAHGVSHTDSCVVDLSNKTADFGPQLEHGRCNGHARERCAQDQRLSSLLLTGAERGRRLFRVRKC